MTVVDTVVKTSAPKFLKPLKDIWTQVGDSILYEVEVSGVPSPRLSWYHNNELIEDKRISLDGNRLQINGVQKEDLGTYSVHARNQHGEIRSMATLNIGDVFDRSGMESEEMQAEDMFDTPVNEDDLMDFEEDAPDRRHSRHHHHIHRKGMAPKFVVGLSDMELKAGDTAAVAGKLQARKRRHRLFERNNQADDEDQNVMPIPEHENSSIQIVCAPI